MKNFYSIQVNDLRFQIDPVDPNKIQLSDEYSGNSAIARINIVFNRQK